jgi:N-acetylglutamate synthase-like GNAT family acetyltransferase
MQGTNQGDGLNGEGQAPFRLRDPLEGDLQWVVRTHGALYAREYGWDASFESMVSQIVDDFVRNFDATRERCWIAEKDGETIGSVFLVRQSEEVAKLRMLIVDPRARGLGLGKRLVAECIAFARLKGYRTLRLWTNDILLSARHIYVEAGFVLVEEERHHSFGHDLVGQNWELSL